MPQALLVRRSAITPPLPEACTRVGNRSALLIGIDGRTAGARRFKEVVSELCADITMLKRQPTGVELHLVRRAALIAIWCEDAEAKMANDEAIDINEFTTATNTLRRILSEIGLSK